MVKKVPSGDKPSVCIMIINIPIQTISYKFSSYSAFFARLQDVISYNRYFIVNNDEQEKLYYRYTVGNGQSR